MKRRVTVVFEVSQQGDIHHFWNKVKTIHSDMAAVGGGIGDYQELMNMYAAFGKFVTSGQPDLNTDPAILIATTGEHFWKSVNGMYADQPDFFSALKVYLNRVALEAAEGVCTEPPTP